MQAIKSILDMLELIHPLGKTAKQAVEGELMLIQPGRKKVLLRGAEAAGGYYFVTSGILRSFYMDGKREITTRFASCLRNRGKSVNFIRHRPGDVIIEIAKGSTVVFLSTTAAARLYDNFPQLNYAGRILAEINDTQSAGIIKILHPKTAAERVLAFAAVYPELINFVPDDQIAGFLQLSRVEFCNKKNSLLQSGNFHERSFG